MGAPASTDRVRSTTEAVPVRVSVTVAAGDGQVEIHAFCVRQGLNCAWRLCYINGRYPMKKNSDTTRPAFALCAMLAFICSGPVCAQEQPIQQTLLLKSEIQGVPGKELRVFRTTYQPGAINTKHYHFTEVVIVDQGQRSTVKMP